MSDNQRSSRWGAPPPDNAPPPISDDEALKALLAEAAAKAEEKQQTAKQRHEDAASNQRKKRPRKKDDEKIDPANDYYGPASGRAKNVQGKASEKDDDEAVDRKRPDFGLSGALAADNSGGGGSNMYKGVLLKFQEPPEARTPNTLWRFYVFKGEEQIDTLHVSKQSAYLWGRNEEIADIPLQHPSCSSQHAVLQYRDMPNKETGKLSCQPYLMDLESTNGSFINGVRIDSARYYQLKKGDVLKFGASTREYVLLTANATSVK
jgi:smad nuclear-interacting protein 1